MATGRGNKFKRPDETFLAGQRILGIDPASVHMGYGVLTFNLDGGHPLFGTIDANPKDSVPARYWYILSTLENLVIGVRPSLIAIERAHPMADAKSSNLSTSLRVGGGAVIAMILAGKYDIPCVELVPSTVKKAVTGHGGATKDGVRKIIQAEFSIKGAIPEDASDALAVAYTVILRLGQLKIRKGTVITCKEELMATLPLLTKSMR